MGECLEYISKGDYGPLHPNTLLVMEHFSGNSSRIHSYVLMYTVGSIKHSLLCVYYIKRTFTLTLDSNLDSVNNVDREQCTLNQQRCLRGKNVGPETHVLRLAKNRN